MLKLVLWLLGVPSAVPFLEALCYTGYPLVSVCINTVVVTLLGEPRPCSLACLIQLLCQQSTQGIKLSCWLHLEDLFEAKSRGIIQYVTCIFLETGHVTSLFLCKVTLYGRNERSLLCGSPLCLSCQFTFATFVTGGWSYYAAWIYGSLCMATFIVRTMKRVLFREARQYSEHLPLCSAHHVQ